jgi:hypothetical protein
MLATVVLAACGVHTAHAQQVAITFEDTITSPIPPQAFGDVAIVYETPSDGQPPIAFFTQGFAFGGLTDGFTLEPASAPDLAIVVNSGNCPGVFGFPCVSNGTRYFAGGDEAFSLTAQSGGFFRLTSIDAGPVFPTAGCPSDCQSGEGAANTTATRLFVGGVRGNTLVVVEELTLSADFQTFVLSSPDFANVSRVLFVAVNEVDGRSVAAIDNIRLTRFNHSASSDFDGDSRSDITVFRPSDGIWYNLSSSSNFTAAKGTQWGNGSDTPVPGDYDGDHQTDVAVFRPSDGTWYIIRSSTQAPVGVQWGNGSDVPVPGDYDGDGKTDIAVFRPSDGIWYVIQSSTGTAIGRQWGNGSDIPVPADYDADGKTDLAVFRPSDGVWYIVRSSTNAPSGVQWGNGSDLPVPGDYDGDAKADIAVFRPSDGTWYISQSTLGPKGVQWGSGTGDVPVPGDFDLDGKTDIAIFRRSTGTWFVIGSGSPSPFGIEWGNVADVPILKKP